MRSRYIHSTHPLAGYSFKERMVARNPDVLLVRAKHNEINFWHKLLPNLVNTTQICHRRIVAFMTSHYHIAFLDGFDRYHSSGSVNQGVSPEARLQQAAIVMPSRTAVNIGKIRAITRLWWTALWTPNRVALGAHVLR